MKSIISLRFVAISFIAGTVLLFSCQRNGGANNAETTEVTQVELSTDADNLSSETNDLAISGDSMDTYDQDTTAITIPEVESEYSYKTITNEDGTMGYMVMKNDEVIVNQPFIPRKGSKKGFNSEAQAIKAATWVIAKLEEGIYPPPTISESELNEILGM